MTFHTILNKHRDLSFSDLESAPVDWESLNNGIFGVKARLAKKVIRSHQREAINKVHTLGTPINNFFHFIDT